MEAAEEKGTDVVLFNQRQDPDANLTFRVESGRVNGSFRVNGQDHDLASFTGIYMRMMDYQNLPGNRPHRMGYLDQDRVTHSAMLHTALIEWFEMSECRVMNRVSAMNSNGSKPYQAQFIIREGFLTPKTLVSNNPEEVLAFAKSCGTCIYKSISGERSIVKTLDEEKKKDIDAVRYLPTQFQEWIPGTDIRVHVAGQEVFATEICSDAIDYRYAHQDQLEIEMRPFELPGEIRSRCLSLSARLNLPLCGIDLRRTPSDEYYCFEVNPSPAYSYYQENTGQDIASAILAYLGGNT